MGKGKRIPSYRRHSSGQARVTIRGRDIMLGPFDSAESRAKYSKLVAEYLASDCATSFGVEPESLLVGDLVADYLLHAKTYFGETTEGKNVKRAMAPVAKLYMDLPANEFGPIQFKAVRADWMRSGITKKQGETQVDGKTDEEIDKRSRGYVNGQMARVLRFLKWAVGEGKIPSSVYESCRCVAPLKRGKCGLEDREPVQPVDVATVEKTLRHMSRVLADMVRLQLATACRPGELVQLTPSMIDRSGDVWKIDFANHKNAHRGKSRIVYVGPKGQEVLKPYLFRGPNETCFSPMESEQQRRGGYVKRTRKPRRAPGTSFTTETYGRAVRNACKRGDIEPWSPNQLRHTAATLIRKEFGLEAAQVILGHAEVGTTQIYAERDQQKAIEIARRIG